MRMRISLAILAISVAAAMLSASDEVKIKKVPVVQVNPTSGHEMYSNYCAACHGPAGKGNGPATPALKKAPTDLTLLTMKNNGKFPDRRVAETIRGDTEILAHGSMAMPVWGSLFRTIGRGDDLEIGLRVKNLTDYVRTLQAK